MLARKISDGTYVNLIANGSDLNYLYDFTSSQKIQLDLIVQNPIPLNIYDYLQVVVTSRNRNSNSHTAQVYFQSSNTYSHIHTSFNREGPTGFTGPLGPTGPTGLLGPTGVQGPVGSGGALGYWGSFWSDVSHKYCWRNRNGNDIK